jgi:hypothetical protein
MWENVNLNMNFLGFAASVTARSGPSTLLENAKNVEAK